MNDLILKAYPQNMNGYSAVARPIYDEMLGDGKVFSTLGRLKSIAGFGMNLANPQVDVLTLTPTQNYEANQNWRPFHTGNNNGFSQVDQPEVYGTGSSISNYGYSSGMKFFGTTSGTGMGESGIYQLVENLIVGSEYELTIKMEGGSGSNGIMQYGELGDARFLGGGAFLNHSSNEGTYTLRFTPQTSVEILTITYQTFTNRPAYLESISLKLAERMEGFEFADIYENQEILDLSDSKIPLTLSVDNFKNVAEKTQSHSHNFTLPSTKTNDKFFYQYFDVTTSNNGLKNTFNPHKQTRITLSEDGILIFEGYMKLSNVDFVDGIPMYSVHLYSDVVSLADALKERKIKDLDFEELTHIAHSGNIEDSWTGELELLNDLATDSYAYNGVDLDKTDVIKYPLVDWSGEVSPTTDGSGVVDGIQFFDLNDAFRPFIKVKYLLNRIFNEAGFSYESNFMDEAHFDKLYMDFSSGQGNTGSITNEAIIQMEADTDGSLNNLATTTWKSSQFNDAANGTSTSMMMNYYGGVTLSGLPAGNNTFTCLNPNQKVRVQSHQRFMNNSTTERKVKSAIHHTRAVDGFVTKYDMQEIYINGGQGSNRFGWIDIDVEITCDAGDTLKLMYKDPKGSGQMYSSPTEEAFLRFTQDVIIVNTTSLLNTKRGDMSQWELVKSLFSMFNLVAMPTGDDTKNIKIEPYTDVFINNSDIKVHDWTNKENIGQRKIKPLKLSKHLTYDYSVDSNDANAKIYMNAMVTTPVYNEGHHGSHRITNKELTLLTGESKTEVESLSSTLMTYMLTGYTGTPYVPTIYGDKDGKREVIDNRARILYDNGVKTGTMPYSTPYQNSNTERFDRKYSYLQFSTEYDNSSRSLLFGTHPKTDNTGYNHLDNLYNMYWSPYIDELYNTDTRVVNTEIVLSASDLAAFRFYDKVILQNREFRVNKIDYKAGDISRVELVLIP